MDLATILKEFHDEREAVEQTIAILDRLAAGQGKRRGRPPVWMKESRMLAARVAALHPPSYLFLAI